MWPCDSGPSVPSAWAARAITAEFQWREAERGHRVLSRILNKEE